jgi:hypothetical protein
MSTNRRTEIFSVGGELGKISVCSHNLKQDITVKLPLETTTAKITFEHTAAVLPSTRSIILVLHASTGTGSQGYTIRYRSLTRLSPRDLACGTLGYDEKDFGREIVGAKSIGAASLCVWRLSLT